MYFIMQNSRSLKEAFDFLLVFILYANCVSRPSSLFLCCLLWSRPNLLADCLPHPSSLSLFCLLWSRTIVSTYFLSLPLSCLSWSRPIVLAYCLSHPSFLFLFCMFWSRPILLAVSLALIPFPFSITYSLDSFF